MSIRELTSAECRRVAFGNEEVIEEIVVVGRRPDRPSISSDFGLQAMQEQIQQQQMMDMLASMQESTAQLPEHLDDERQRDEHDPTGDILQELTDAGVKVLENDDGSMTFKYGNITIQVAADVVENVRLLGLVASAVSLATNEAFWNGIDIYHVRQFANQHQSNLMSSGGDLTSMDEINSAIGKGDFAKAVALVVAGNPEMGENLQDKLTGN